MRAKSVLPILVFVSVVRSGAGTRSRHHERQFVDLTHPFDEKVPVRDGGAPPELNPSYQDESFGARSEYLDFCASEKLGTHINAPKTYQHNANQSHSVDRIPLKLLINLPGVVIDLPASKDGEDRSAVLSRQHLEEWEKENERIPHSAFVILRTGWSTFYHFPDKFFGNFDGEDNQMFPGFSEDAVNWLLDERGISGLGTECPDVELPWKTKQVVKHRLAISNRYSVVQLAHANLLPATGFDVTVAPLKLKGGSGGPTRVFAILHNGHHNSQRHNNNNGGNGNGHSNDKYDSEPEQSFHTESPQKVRRVEPRDQNSRHFGSEESSPVIVSTAEEYHNAAGILSRTTTTSFCLFSSLLLLISSLLIRF